MKIEVTLHDYKGIRKFDSNEDEVKDLLRQAYDDGKSRLQAAASKFKFASTGSKQTTDDCISYEIYMEPALLTGTQMNKVLIKHSRKNMRPYMVVRSKNM